MRRSSNPSDIENPHLDYQSKSLRSHICPEMATPSAAKPAKQRSVACPDTDARATDRACAVQVIFSHNYDLHTAERQFPEPTAMQRLTRGKARSAKLAQVSRVPEVKVESSRSFFRPLWLTKKLLGAPGIATRSKDATRGSWPYY